LLLLICYISFFFFNTPAPPEPYTLSLHDALPICTDTLGAGSAMRSASVKSRSDAMRGLRVVRYAGWRFIATTPLTLRLPRVLSQDRKSTRLNSSHSQISYAVFCLKKKK